MHASIYSLLYCILGIPLLVIIDGDGNLITKEARNIIHTDEPQKYANVWDKFTK